jgi:hypothetical protein
MHTDLGLGVNIVKIFFCLLILGTEIVWNLTESILVKNKKVGIAVYNCKSFILGNHDSFKMVRKPYHGDMLYASWLHKYLQLANLLSTIQSFLNKISCYKLQPPVWNILAQLPSCMHLLKLWTLIYAFLFVLSRAYTVSELRKKLCGKNYSVDTVDSVIADFKSR